VRGGEGNDVSGRGGDPRLVVEEDDLVCPGEGAEKGEEASSPLPVHAEEGIVEEEGHSGGRGDSGEEGEMPGEEGLILHPFTHLPEGSLSSPSRRDEAQAVFWGTADPDVPPGRHLRDKCAGLCLDGGQQGRAEPSEESFQGGEERVYRRRGTFS